MPAAARLRVRHEWPHRCPAEKRHAIASSKAIEFHLLPQPLEWQHSGSSSVKSGSLRCGILERLLTKDLAGPQVDYSPHKRPTQRERRHNVSLFANPPAFAASG